MRSEIEIKWHSGPRDELRPLFELAEDSRAELDGYLMLGRVLVALQGDEVVGHLQLVDGEEPGSAEIKNLAVAGARQGTGIGRRLVEAAVAECEDTGASLMVVATAAADIGNLRFYQRLGFRMRSVERDAFTPATGYTEDVTVDGIPLRDRVWLSRDL